MKNIQYLFSCFFLFSITPISSIAFSAESIDMTCFKESASFSVDSGKDIKGNVIGTNGEIFFLQDNILIPYKILSYEKPKYIDYTVIDNTSGKKEDLKYINDGNSATVFDFDSLHNNKKSITIDFGKQLQENTFDHYFIFNHHGSTSFLIGDTLDSLKNVKENNIGQFSFRYLRINFDNYTRDTSSIPTGIVEVNFFIPGPITYIVKPNKAGTIESYRAYDCESEKMRDILNDYGKLNRKTQFSIDSSTKEINVLFQNNPRYNNDFDSDGVNNERDNCRFNVNKDQLDSDQDGIGDVCDMDKFNKNPNDGDIDKDSISDNQDNCKYIYNPHQKDSNADGIGDICSDDDNDGIIGKNDNCPTISNLDQKDVNANGIGDACEFDTDKDSIFDSIDTCISTANPDQKDVDSDGIGDACDNCKLYNPSQRDVDHNGIGDVCEEADKYAKENDTDKDSILDFNDNCPKIANKDQLDGDHDRVGDACDNCIGIQNTDQKDENKNSKGDMCEDVDGDGVDGFKDNCPTISNPDQKDSNNSGIGDVCKDEDGDGIIFQKDNCPYEYNPDQNDVDADGKGDICDTKDNRYIESNRGFFAGLMILIIAIFGVGIYGMIRKLKGK